MTYSRRSDTPELTAVDQVMARIRAVAPGAFVVKLGFDAGEHDPATRFRITQDGFAEAGRRRMAGSGRRGGAVRRTALSAAALSAEATRDRQGVVRALDFTMRSGMLVEAISESLAMEHAIEAGESKRLPGRKPGPAQRAELLRIWDAVDDDGRKMLLFIARTVAVKQGLAAGGTALLGAEPVL